MLTWPLTLYMTPKDRSNFISWFLSILIMSGAFSTIVMKLACPGRISKLPLVFFELTDRASFSNRTF